MICNFGCTICNFPERMLVCHRHPSGPTSYINSTYFHGFPSFPPSSSSLKTVFQQHHSTFLIYSADCHRNRAGKHAFSIGSIAAHRETKDSWKPTSRKLSWPTVDVVCRVLTPVSLLSKIRWGVLQLLTGSCRCHLPRSSNSRPISPSLVKHSRVDVPHISISAHCSLRRRELSISLISDLNFWGIGAHCFSTICWQWTWLLELRCILGTLGHWCKRSELPSPAPCARRRNLHPNRHLWCRGVLAFVERSEVIQVALGFRSLTFVQ